MLSPTKFDQQHLWHPYAPSPAPYSHHLVKSAQGVWLTLEDGTKVIDGMSSWWAVIHGYGHPILNQAIKTQVDAMSHIMFGGLTHQPAIDLVQKLIELTPQKLDKVFFSDSGSVAVEVAMKMALQYFQSKNSLKKTRFITPLGGYHGDTFGAMSLCDPETGMHHLFANTLPKHIFAKQPNHPDAIADLSQKFAQHHQNIAAMVLEPIVQGAGGMAIYPAQYLQDVRELCNQYGVLLIVDEIATGFGRTGKLFACEWAEVEADILCLGKAITGGYLSLGTTMTSQKIAQTLGTLMHGPTFMANPLACAVANASIDVLLASNWQDNIKHIEQTFLTHLQPLKHNKKVKSVRILGAIAVLELHQIIDVPSLQNTLIKHKVWLRPFGKLLYTMPAFNINNAELLTLVHAIKTVLK